MIVPGHVKGILIEGCCLLERFLIGRYLGKTLVPSSAKTDLIKKKLCTIFSKNGLRITIEVNKHTVNFLDVTLDLKNGRHRPFSKPGNIPLYVNSKSNHPPRIIQNIPKSINQRLSEISSDQESFEQAAPLYQKKY